VAFPHSSGFNDIERNFKIFESVCKIRIKLNACLAAKGLQRRLSPG
jgi:hypothetical protein